MTHRVFGIIGWKNSGKTTLVERLVVEFVRRGWRVSTVKHAHHTVDIDKPGTDSYRHRAAGATEVALIGGERYAIMRETAEPPLWEVLDRLSPCDLVLIEGYKREPHLKLEVRTDHLRPMAPADRNIVAISSDVAPVGENLPWFGRSDVVAMADFIAARASDEPAPCD